MRFLKAKRLSLVFAFLAILALIVGACGGGSDKTATPKPPATTGATTQATATSKPAPTSTFQGAITATPTPVTEQPRPGGVLRMRELVAFEPMDTFNLRSKFGALWLQNILSNLVRQDPQQPSKIINDLADTWDVSSDGKTYTFHLNPNAKFHDGKPVTAADIVFNIDRGRNPSSPLLSANSQPLKVVESDTAVDDRTVKVTLSRPSAYFLAGIAAPFFLIYPASLVDPTANFVKTPVGSGPFKITNYTSNQSATLAKNPTYHIKDEQGRTLPYLDGIDYQFITDNTAALAAFRTGRLDCGCGSDFTTPLGDTVKKENPSVNVVSFSEDAIHFFFKNAPPWNDLRVRQAVHYAMDYRQLNAVSRGGTGFYPPTFILAKELGGNWALPASEILQMPGYRDPKTADVANAKALLAAAGIDPSKTAMKLQGIGFYRDFMEAFATALKAQGWQVNLILSPSGSPQLTTALSQGDFDIGFNGGGRAIDDPADIFLEYTVSTAGSNWGKWSYPKVDQLAASQDQELDPTKRAQQIADLQREVINQLEFIPALNIVTTKVLYPWVKGFFPGRYDVSSALRFERLWLGDRTQ